MDKNHHQFIQRLKQYLFCFKINKREVSINNIALIFIFFALLSCKNKDTKLNNITVDINQDSVLVEEDSTETDSSNGEATVIKVETIALDNSELQQFIPKNFVVVDTLSDDLNKDSLDDYVIMIKDTNPEYVGRNNYNQIVDRNRRGIIILFRENDGYKKIVENRSCFSSENEDGGAYIAPELSIEINQKHNLIIHYSHGRYGYWYYTFRYQHNAFELIGFDISNNRGPIIESQISINFITKKMRKLTKTNEDCESGEEVFEEKWENIKVDHLHNLQDINTLIYLCINWF